MTRRSVLLLALILAIPMYGRPAKHAQLRPVSASSLHAEHLSNPRARALQFLANMRAAQTRSAQRRQVTPNAIITNRSARALVIPAAGSVQGANGTFFRSDVTIANWNDTSQLIGVLWLPNGDPNGLDALILALDESSIVTVEDFVGEFLELQGLGSLILLPLANEEGDFDDNAAFDVYSRIWTPQPNATGTVSQPFPGVEPDYMTNEEEGIVLGLRQNAQYRTNYGIMNISEDDLTFNMRVESEESSDAVTTVTVPSLSMVQTGIPAGTYGALSLSFEVTSTPTSEFTWVAYGTSTDNTTGDGWVSIVANPWNDAQLDASEGAQ
jgi:hypothetical protein